MMELLFEQVKSKNLKKVKAINNLIRKDVPKIEWGIETLIINWSQKKFKQVMGKKKFLPEVRGGQIFALINFKNKDTLEVCFNPSRLQEKFPSSFFRFAFLHEIGHALFSQRQIFVEDVPSLNKVLKAFVKEHKELKDETYFLNYIIDEMSVDMNFIEHHQWSKDVFLGASTYMLKHYTSHDMLSYHTQTKGLCLLYILSASRFFIPIGFLISPHIFAYERLLNYFEENKQAKLITEFNNGISDFIYCLYNHEHDTKLVRNYKSVLKTMAQIHKTCFKELPN